MESKKFLNLAIIVTIILLSGIYVGYVFFYSDEVVTKETERTIPSDEFDYQESFLNKDSNEFGEDTFENTEENIENETTEEPVSEEESENILVTAIKISGKTTVDINKKIKLTATISPNNASNKKVNWTSSNKNIATVDQDGNVLGLKEGTVTISATSVSNNKIKATYKVVVNKASTQTSSSNETTSESKTDASTSTDAKVSCESKLKSYPNPSKAKTFVKYETVEENVSSDYKYGLKQNSKITKTYAYFTDTTAEKCLYKETTKNTYDQKGYNAKTNDLKSEAEEVKSKNQSDINEVLNYTNSYRKEVNVANLTLDSTLTTMANIRALEIAYSGIFDHRRPNSYADTNLWSIFTEFNYTTNARGENIAYGPTSGKGAAELWKSSQGHYENMVSAEFHKIGIGKATFNGKTYWVQLFAS